MVNITTSKLKRAIINYLIKDDELVDLIDATEISYVDDLLNTHIFPHIKVDFTVEDVGTYIGLKIAYPEINDNEIFKDFQLYIMIISNNRHLKTTTGDSRTDMLGEKIVSLLNWNNEIPFAFRLKLLSDIENPLDEDFYYRQIIFESYSPNSIENGIKKYQ